MMKNSGTFLLSALVIAGSTWVSTAAYAVVSAEQAQKLKTTLTPFGAEKEANTQGSIPAWDGGIHKAMIPSSYKGAGFHHPDPFANEKPLYIIDANNMTQHKPLLSEGLAALFKTYPESFRVPVYPTHRTHTTPNWVIENTFKNATSAKLTTSGNGIENAIGGIPFPIPQNGLEVLWNHMTRFRGSYVVRDSAETAVQSNGKFVIINGHTEVNFAYYDQTKTAAQLNNALFYYLNEIKGPARLAGGATLVHEKLNQELEPRQAWVYNAGQRRVRRAPNLSFDSPISESEGLRTADDTDMFNGSPERYNWKLIGKKELVIPYNNYRLDDQALKYDQILKAGHVNPEHARYELHRVWVVEGTLKDGQRHIYSKRRFYIDEDSWSIALAEQYDGRGELWRVSIAYLKNYYDVPLTWTALDSYHDLQAKRYHVQFLDNEEPKTLDFAQKAPPAAHFDPSELRRLGKR